MDGGVAPYPATTLLDWDKQLNFLDICTANTKEMFRLNIITINYTVKH